MAQSRAETTGELEGKHRPKTDIEYLWAFRAAVATWELMRYERMKVPITVLERRPAVERLHRRIFAETATDKEFVTMRKSAREGASLFFTDPDYRTKFADYLERAGLGTRAVDAAAFERSLQSMIMIDRQIKVLEKRLADCLKNLETAYAKRDPEDRMPRSAAADRADSLRNRKKDTQT